MPTKAREIARVAALAVWVWACAGFASGASDVSGAWAELQVLSEYATLPLVGEVQRTSAIVLRVAIEPSAGGYLLRQTYCATDILHDSAIGSAVASTTIPEAFLASLGEVVAQASAEPSGSSLRFLQPWATEIRGALLEDESDPLPTSPDDPRVIDQDGDGKPGLTVGVSALGILTGEVYVVQRVRTRLVGVVASRDRIDGLIEWSTEQVSLGATSPLFLGTLPSRPDPLATNSLFVLVRIDPAWTCAEILSHRTSLFGVLDPTQGKP